MIGIDKITKIDKKRIALMDTSSISFIQSLQNKGIKIDSILKDYELILIPGWVLAEIEDAPGRAEFIRNLVDGGYPIYYIDEESYSELTGYEEGNLYETLTVYSQDSDTYKFHLEAEARIRKQFASKIPAPVSYKSNDCILCQLFREGEIKKEDIQECRKDERKITYSMEQSDYSTALVTEMVDNDKFIDLIKNKSVHIIF